MSDEFKNQEIKAWREVLENTVLQRNDPKLYQGLVIARLNGLVNTGIITWEEWRELRCEVEDRISNS